MLSRQAVAVRALLVDCSTGCLAYRRKAAGSGQSGQWRRKTWIVRAVGPHGATISRHAGFSSIGLSTAPAGVESPE